MNLFYIKKDVLDKHTKGKQWDINLRSPIGMYTELNLISTWNFRGILGHINREIQSLVVITIDHTLASHLKKHVLNVLATNMSNLLIARNKGMEIPELFDTLKQMYIMYQNPAIDFNSMAKEVQIQNLIVDELVNGEGFHFELLDVSPPENNRNEFIGEKQAVSPAPLTALAFWFLYKHKLIGEVPFSYFKDCVDNLTGKVVSKYFLKPDSNDTKKFLTKSGEKVSKKNVLEYVNYVFDTLFEIQKIHNIKEEIQKRVSKDEITSN